MPYTLKSNRAKFKDANGEYKEFDLISEQSTAAQLDAIEEKGAETRASIPADYTALSDSVDDLKNALNDKWHLCLNASSFDKKYFNVDGTFRRSESLPMWAGHQKYVHVGNAKALVFHHSYSLPIQLNLYRFNKNKEGIALVQISVEPETYYHHSVESGTYFYAVSICDTADNNFSLNDVDPKIWLIEYDCTASNAESFVPEISSYSFTDYATVGNKDEEYSSLETAYNAMSGKKGIMIVSPGTYNVDGYGFLPADLYMIGSAAELVRLVNNTAVYPHSASEVKGEGYIKNTAFVSKNDNYQNGAYGVHIESNDCQGKTIYFKDCVFESQWNSAFGVGLRKDMHLIFENCRFVNLWECGINGHQPYEYDKSGALFFHPSIDSQNYGTQHITCINCVFESKGAGALRMETVDGNLLIATFIDCTFVSGFYGNMNPVDIIGGAERGYLCGQSIKLGKASHGNNVSSLNADEYGLTP